MNKNITISLIVIVVLVVGYLFINKKTPNEEINTNTQGKIDINAVCEGALAYMSFPDGASAEKFVAECKEGKHPQVIEDYKKQLNLGEGVAI